MAVSQMSDRHAGRTWDSQAAATQPGLVEYLLDTTMADAFAKGAMLQIILLFILFGPAAVQIGPA